MAPGGRTGEELCVWAQSFPALHALAQAPHLPGAVAVPTGALERAGCAQTSAGWTGLFAPQAYPGQAPAPSDVEATPGF